MYKKFKSFVKNEQVFTTFLIVFVAFSSFFLGRESVSTATKISSNQSPIVLTAQGFGAFSTSSVSLTTASTSENVDPTSTTMPYVASKAGKKYHHLTCSGAKLIKETNKIFFASPNQAEAAGYSRASNCDR